MSFLADLYHTSLVENKKNMHFWKDYLAKLKSLDFDAFSDKLTVPVLVPIGSRIFFRGHLKHTNEVIASLGADYFAKCSLKQADVLRQHRIKGAESKLQAFRNERSYLENQISFSKNNVYESNGEKIVEFCTDEEDKAWRENHRESVRKHKQMKTEDTIETTDEELWDRLEELELQEELDRELDNFNIGERKDDKEILFADRSTVQTEPTVGDTKEQFAELNNSNAPKLDLQEVLYKYKDLEQKLTELENKKKGQINTENDLMSRLDEIEQLDDLEHEMDRLEDILLNEEEENIELLPETKTKRGVSFADEDDSETLQLIFKHSEEVPNFDPYDPEKGILKPNDIYEAYSNLFRPETTSILKKTRHDVLEFPVAMNVEKKVVTKSEDIHIVQPETIVIKDVLEKNEQNYDTLENACRPVSLFKQRRQKKT